MKDFNVSLCVVGVQGLVCLVKLVPGGRLFVEFNNDIDSGDYNRVKVSFFEEGCFTVEDLLH